MLKYDESLEEYVSHCAIPEYNDVVYMFKIPDDEAIHLKKTQLILQCIEYYQDRYSSARFMCGGLDQSTFELSFFNMLYRKYKLKYETLKNSIERKYLPEEYKRQLFESNKYYWYQGEYGRGEDKEYKISRDDGSIYVGYVIPTR